MAAVTMGKMEDMKRYNGLERKNTKTFTNKGDRVLNRSII